MSSSMKTIIILVVMALSLAGCGDLLGTKVVKRQLDGSQFQVECELDMDKFTEIMNENISSQIRCLGENLNLFVKIVKSGKPGYLSRVQLEEYLATHRPDVKPEVVKALKSVFALGHLITGEDPDYISKDTINKVINFALIFNQEAALNFGPIFENESPVTYALHQNHRERVSSANKVIIQALRTIYNPNRNGQIHKLNIIELLESFSTESTRETIVTAKKVLFLKKVLLGGENEVITHNELEKLILNFDHLLLVGLDIVRYKYIILNQESILQLLKRDVNDLFEIVTQGVLNNRDSEILFTVKEAIEAADEFITDEDFEITNFQNLIGEAKKIIMTGSTDTVSGGELKVLFTHAKSLLQTGTIFHRIYDKFRVQLENPRPVEETINFDEYRHTYPEHQAELDQFERITKKYRFMKGEFLNPYYIRGFKRNADAIFEIALLEYGLKLLFAAKGKPSPNTDAIGGYSMDQERMRKLFTDFESELVELDLILPGRAVGTADNITLLGTLFQYQSDKNEKMDVNEAAEFAEVLLGSFNIADDLYSYMKEELKCPADDYKRIEPKCFRKNFWRGLCTYYRGYFPLMFDSIGIGEKCENTINEYNNVFLDKAISAARTCNYYTDGDKEEIYYAKGDFMTISLALMHAETTVLRWDYSGNNVMDANEVNLAYDIYSSALDGFLKDKNPIIKALKKQIYQYMIKYEQVPDEKDFGSIWKFLKFLLNFDKKSPATRKTIVSLLEVIGKQNAKLQTGTPFDCNKLRDPEKLKKEFIESKSVPAPTVTPKQEIDVLAVLGGTAQIVYSFGYSKDQLKEELNYFSDDMINGRVSKIKDVRQPVLKAIFSAIAANKGEMANINYVINEGTELHKIAFAVTAIVVN